MNSIILILGFLFGASLQYAYLNKYDVISALSTRENLAVVKAIAIAIGIGAIILNLAIALGLAHYHIKPFVVGGLIIGGLLFGTGMAILGYCPGTLSVSCGEGSVDAWLGVIGGVLGGLFYTVILPFIQPVLGPNLGKISLQSLVGSTTIFYVLMCIVGFIFIMVAFGLHKIDKNKDKKWIVSGIALALLNTVVFLTAVTNRPIGASTAFPYVGDSIFHFTDNNYFDKIQTPGHWEMIFLAGAFISGFVISNIRKDFKINALPVNWVKYKGNSVSKRLIWSFVGGFILIFGARMAGGCTSGHILSGGMQLAFSSLFFAIFVFAGVLITGKIFYKKRI